MNTDKKLCKLPSLHLLATRRPCRLTIWPTSQAAPSDPGHVDLLNYLVAINRMAGQYADIFSVLQAKKGPPSYRMKSARVSCTQSRPFSLHVSHKPKAASKMPYVCWGPASLPAEWRLLGHSRFLEGAMRSGKRPSRELERSFSFEVSPCTWGLGLDLPRALRAFPTLPPTMPMFSHHSGSIPLPDYSSHPKE